ncbi:hypothetical protein CPB84DRAFT_1779098, partial [Gymnopilus junonius]
MAARISIWGVLSQSSEQNRARSSTSAAIVLGNFAFQGSWVSATEFLLPKYSLPQASIQQSTMAGIYSCFRGGKRGIGLSDWLPMQHPFVRIFLEFLHLLAWPEIVKMRPVVCLG